MALNYYFGYDENGRVGRRTTGLRPPFGGNNRLMFITHRTPKYTECDEVSGILIDWFCVGLCLGDLSVTLN